jgi:DNA-binding transcriptional LysR family regulator
MDIFRLARLSLPLLRAFESVARHLSFTRAAAEIGRSQATLSVQVRELERQLDVRLLDRTTRRVGLTDAGVALAKGLQQGFEAIDAGLAAARDLSGRRRGRIVVACVPSLCGVRLPEMLAGYGRRGNDARIDIDELTYVEMVEAIIRGKVDFGIGPCAEVPPPDIAFTMPVDDPLCVVMSAKYGGRKYESAPLSMLGSLSLILLKTSLPFQNELKEATKSRGITLNSPTKVGHVQTAIGLVRAGVGAAIVPRLALPDLLDPDLVVLSITDPVLTRKVGILTFRGRRLSANAAKLIRYLSGRLQGAIPAVQQSSSVLKPGKISGS